MQHVQDVWEVRKMLEQERSVYDQHLAEWLKTYSGKYVLVKATDLIGVYDTPDAALAEGARRFGVSPFLVRPVQETQEQVVVPALMLGIISANIQHATIGSGT